MMRSMISSLLGEDPRSSSRGRGKSPRSQQKSRDDDRRKKQKKATQENRKKKVDPEQVVERVADSIVEFIRAKTEHTRTRTEDRLQRRKDRKKLKPQTDGAHPFTQAFPPQPPADIPPRGGQGYPTNSGTGHTYTTAYENQPEMQMREHVRDRGRRRRRQTPAPHESEWLREEDVEELWAPPKPSNRIEESPNILRSPGANRPSRTARHGHRRRSSA